MRNPTLEKHAGIINPCQKSCDKRSITCHSTCEAYLEYRQQIDLATKKKQRNYYLNNVGRLPFKAR